MTETAQTKKPGEIMAEWAKSKVGCGYVYGATGWICSQARREQQAKQYPDYADTIMTTCAKWDGKQCYDCAQLTRYAAKEAGVTIPSGATSQWNKNDWESSGTIDSLPDEPGVLLYRQKGTKMQHTGIYIGNGRVVDSRGSAYGVMESALTSYSWTHWGRLVYNASEAKEDKEVIRNAIVTKTATATGSTVNLRKSASTKAAVMATVPFGTAVEITQEADGWCELTYNGKTGWMMDKFLPVTGDEGDSTGDAPGGTTENPPVPTGVKEKITAAVNLLNEALAELT